MLLFYQALIYPCHTNIPFLYPLKASGNQRYVRSDVMCLSCLRDSILHISAIYTAIVIVILVVGYTRKKIFFEGTSLFVSTLCQNTRKKFFLKKNFFCKVCRANNDPKSKKKTVIFTQNCTLKCRSHFSFH